MKKIIFTTLLVCILIGIGVFSMHKIAARTPALGSTSEINVNNVLKNLIGALAKENNLPFHSEKKYGFFGSATLTGYVITHPSQCGVGDSLPCDETNQFDYTYFRIVKSENEEIFDFLKERKGKPFITQGAIGLGCYVKEEGRLFSKNSGDRGSYNNLVTGESLKQLMASGPKNYVQLRITRPIYTDRKIAPYCYSLFRNFKILPKTLSATTATSSTTVTATSTEPTL